MRTSCVLHPANEPYIAIKQWHVQFCDGDLCAAALLSFFESEADRQGTDWRPYTSQQLQDGIIGMYSEKPIRQAVRLLVVKGAILVGKNPDPDFGWMDHTKHFKYQPLVIASWLSQRIG